MPLTTISELYPDYKDRIFDGEDIKGYSVYSDGEEKIGDVHDILVDETGHLRYLVIDTGFWFFGKQVLLPIGRARVDYANHRIYVLGLTKDQAEHLPEYRTDMVVDYDYEEKVRDTYRPATTASTAAVAGTSSAGYTRDNYRYDNDPSLYDLNEESHQRLKLYEERLVANKDRQKTGEVAVGKTVETETARVSVPVEKERIVIQRTTPNSTEAVAPGTATFDEGEVARMEVYEETANVEKQAFVREEVEIRKEVDRSTVDAEETIRRERLNIDSHGNPIVDGDIHP
ncbi:DUF2382 domain-containing protein [Oscillatoria sp. FACHB-1406]|uniref:DUF2382 domain-containing protein n=1 Tax=Oscillatoria sp. FACHB-1406 TaxID=2692846 RepID=UPI0016830ADE|nr:DUF2382 domain-containing protein [Oscillatoria sp. FACHB-1406]MBD2580645.1 DUF2382 domain-containing protein [Oscillatoria sp. FACHB-1406]